MGSLRIIAGDLRGRLLKVPRGSAVRPTPERVREALFSILGPRVSGAAVLDAFAGSGALGLEALSRGARRAVFVESAREALAVLRANIAALGLAERTSVLAGTFEQLALGGRLRGPFDLVFADPPYDVGPVRGVLDTIRRARLLAEGGTLVFQRDRATELVEAAGGWQLADSRSYGRTALDFYRRSTPEKA